MKINISAIFQIIVLFFMFSGCLSVKPTSVRTGGNLFETFYVGERGTQYFIKPLPFLNIKNKEEAHLDFTFSYKNILKDSSVINISIFSNNIIKNIDSLTISNKTHKVFAIENRLLFNEKLKNQFNSRFSTKISLLDLNLLFQYSDWNIHVYYGRNSYVFESEKKSIKAIKKLQNQLFILFQ
jgi:hypothetical protein